MNKQANSTVMKYRRIWTILTGDLFCADHEVWPPVVLRSLHEIGNSAGFAEYE